MSTSAANTPLTLRRLGIALGAAFVGSTLVAVASPAIAQPTDPGGPSPSPTPPPAPVAAVAFARDADSVALGTPAPPNTLTLSNTGTLDICVIGLEIGGGFQGHGFAAGRLAAGASDTVMVTGSPRRSTDVVATLTFAAADPETGCATPPGDVHSISSGVWAVTITGPSPSPSPTPSPTPTRPDPPAESPSPTPSGRPTPSATPTAPGSETSGRPSSRPSSGTTSRPSTPDRPRSSVSDVPTTGSNIPTLPRNEADLPDVLPGEDLATLPLATPTGSDDAAETEVAAEHTDMGPNMAPAVLLAAFLLTLLLAAPLAPTRRVRPGTGGYQGRRRKS